MEMLNRLSGTGETKILIALAGLTIGIANIRDITTELLFVSHFFHL